MTTTLFWRNCNQTAEKLRAVEEDFCYAENLYRQAILKRLVKLEPTVSTRFLIRLKKWRSDDRNIVTIQQEGMSARVKKSFVCWNYSLKSIQQGVYILNVGAAEMAVMDSV